MQLKSQSFCLAFLLTMRGFHDEIVQLPTKLNKIDFLLTSFILQQALRRHTIQVFVWGEPTELKLYGWIFLNNLLGKIKKIVAYFQEAEDRFTPMLMTILIEEYEVKVNCSPIKIVEEVGTPDKLFIFFSTSSKDSSPGDPDVTSDLCKLLRNSVRVSQPTGTKC